MIQASGFVPFSTIDYPKCLAAVVFTQGCPWHCLYCHNPHLHSFQEKSIWDTIVFKLTQRAHLLDAVVFSGGEALLQKNLPLAMQQVKDLGYLVGLHTTGMYPKRFKMVLPLVDWVGMDIKAQFENYSQITGIKNSGALAQESAKILIASGISHEFRTTIHPTLFSVNDLLLLAKDLADMGVQSYALQKARQFREEVQINPNFYKLETYKEIFSLFKSFTIR